MAITVHLSEILKDRHMTAKALCAKVGITEANLSILRSGKANGVRFHTINKICSNPLSQRCPCNIQSKKN